MSPPETVAEVIADELYEAGCRVAFGVPGGEVLTLMDALARRGVDIVLARQETAAAHMAQGVARATGVPGLLFTTVGPGVAMAVDGIASAHQDRVPLIALTGCLDREDLEAGFTHQAFDQMALLAPVTKAQVRVRAEDVAVATRGAITEAVSPRPGPVQLEVAPRIALAKASHAPLPPKETSPDDAHGEALRSMADLLRGAARPLVLIGLDALEPQAAIETRALSEMIGAPVLTTYLAKGVIDETSPLALGAFGLSPAVDRALLPLVASADVVLLIGYDPIEVRAPWTAPFSARATLLEIASVPRSSKLQRVAHRAIGSVARLARLLVSHLTPAAPRLAHAASVRSELVATHAAMDRTAPGRLVSALAAALPEDAAVAVDTGAHRILLSQRWTARSPGLLVQSTGLCTMACAVPLAVGMKVAMPSRPTLAVTGDGGLEMMLGDLATLRDLDLALPIVVFDDQALELIALKQRSMRLPSLGVSSRGTDFVAVARALGGRGVRVDRPEALGDAVRAALASPPFTVLHCPIPRGSYDGIL